MSEPTTVNITLNPIVSKEDFYVAEHPAELLIEADGVLERFIITPPALAEMRKKNGGNYYTAEDDERLDKWGKAAYILQNLIEGGTAYKATKK